MSAPFFRVLCERARSVGTISAIAALAAGCAMSAGTSTPATSASTASATTAPSSSTSATDTTAAGFSTAAPQVSSPASAGAPTCSPDPIAHVYNPERLHLLSPCVTVTGSVSFVRAEPDGDYHVRVVLDQGQRCASQDCLDDANRTQQSGALVVELVCAHDITQGDAISACIGFHSLLPVPAVGERITVTGPWVFDSTHGWNEIHPVESLGGSAPATSSSSAAAPPPQPPPGTFSVTITASRYGYVAATTAPGAACSATAKLPSGRTSTASGLQARPTAGPDGAVSWTYGTSSSTRPGTGTHTVTCTLSGATASASAPFTVG